MYYDATHSRLLKQRSHYRTIHMTWLNYPRQTAQHLFDNVPL